MAASDALIHCRRNACPSGRALWVVTLSVGWSEESQVSSFRSEEFVHSSSVSRFNPADRRAEAMADRTKPYLDPGGKGRLREIVPTPAEDNHYWLSQGACCSIENRIARQKMW